MSWSKRILNKNIELKGFIIKKLYLVRHAKAIWDGGHIGDFDREVSKDGVAGLKAVGVYLMLSGVIPDVILSSPAMRAQKTAEVLAEEMHYYQQIKYMNELYLSSADTMSNLIHHQPDELNSIMIIAHNPGISDLAHKLTGGEILKIPKGAILALSLPIDKWSEMKNDSSTLDFFIHPKQFKYSRPTAPFKKYI